MIQATALAFSRAGIGMFRCRGCRFKDWRGLIPLVSGVRTLRLAHHFGDPVVRSTLPVNQLDQPIIVRLELPVGRDVSLRETRVTLVCDERTGFSSHRLFARSEIAARNQSLRPVQPLLSRRLAWGRGRTVTVPCAALRWPRLKPAIHLTRWITTAIDDPAPAEPQADRPAD